MQALKTVIAVYSSQPTAPLSLAARSSDASTVSFTRLEAEREVIRLPAMRGSVFLIPLDTAPEIFGATSTPLEKLGRRLEHGGLTWQDYERVREEFLAVATSPMTSGELQEAIHVDGKLMVAIRLLAYEGLALRVGEGVRSDTFRYVSAISWLGQALPEREQPAALSWLADAYVRGFGPVRMEDFAWWSGVTKGKAKQAMATVPTEDVGDGLLLHTDDLDAWNDCQPLSEDEVAVLPKWDPYTMGYQSDGRTRFVREEHQALAYPKIRATRGDAAPVVLRRGEAAASWGHRFKRDRMEVVVSPFEPGDSLDWLAEAHFEPAATVLGASDITLRVERD